jgi:ankyrin repeat protein
MKKFLASVFMVLVLIPSALFAQQADSALKKIETYLYSTLDLEAKEAEITAALEKNPDLVQATLENRPVLFWALDSIGVEGDLGVRAGKIAEMLFAHGADVNAKDQDGNPYIFKYAMFAQVKPLEFLVKHDVTVDARDVENNRTPLHWVALLQELDATPEMIAKNIQAATVLLDAKADVNAKDQKGNTPLHNTAYLGNVNMAEFLITKGADINAKTNDGYSVLGLVMLRKEEAFSNEKEKQALEPVIALLQKLEAKDVRPKE